MAQFNPSKKQNTDFNNGNRFINKVDSPNADDFNNVIESQLYVQEYTEALTNAPDVSQADNVGTPTVELIANGNYKKFKFSNLKGNKGDTGVGEKGDKGVSFRNRGTFNISTTYVNNNEFIDVVTYNGSSYVVRDDKSSVVGYEPTNTEHWTLLAEKGKDGATSSNVYVKNVTALSADKQYAIKPTNPLPQTQDDIVTCNLQEVVVPTKTSELTNNSGFITNAVNDLTNYYLKKDTYTKTEVNNLISQITTISFKIVETLPTTGQANIIYLKKISSNVANNIYDEYIWVDNTWEQIGSTAVDLSNYYNKTQVDGKLALKANASDIPTKVGDLQNDKGFIDKSVSDLTNYYNKTKIDTDYAKKTDIPTNNNQLTNGAGYITSSGSCASATNATNDSNGDKITDTYATKTELANGLGTKQNTLTPTQNANINAVPNKADKTYVDEQIGTKQDTLSNQQITNIADVPNKANTSYVNEELAKKANLSGATFTGGVTLNQELKILDAENFDNVYIKRSLGRASSAPAYANIPEADRQGTYRVWKIKFPVNSNFWGKIKITLYGGYSSFNASGTIEKEIICNFNGASIYSNVGSYVKLAGTCEKDFRISEAIWNAETSQWEVWVFSKQLQGNNQPAIMIEFWCYGTTYINTAKDVVFDHTCILTKTTTYQNVKGTPNGATLTKNLLDLPVFETPYGNQVATIQDIPDISNKANVTDLNAHINNQENPHKVTQAQVGLGNVINEKQYCASNPPPYPKQVNSDWNATSGVAKILNKPNTQQVGTISILQDVNGDSTTNLVSQKAVKDALATKQGNLTPTQVNNINDIPNKASKTYVDTELGKKQDNLSDTQIANIADVSNKLDKSGGAMTGAITINGGDGQGLLMPSDGTINATSGNATLFGFLSGTLTMGHTSYPLNLRGSQTRPTYNGNAIALKSDVPTDYATKAYVDDKNYIKDYSNANYKTYFDYSGANLKSNTWIAGLERINNDVFMRVTPSSGLPMSTATKTYVDDELGKKQGNLSEQQLRNIADVPNKATLSDVSTAGFIKNTVNDLTNYYKKSETFTQAEINQKISAIPKFAISVVTSLPTTDISSTTVYLLKTSTTETQNLYTEYIYVKNAWEKLGTQKVDLTDYYNKTQVNGLLDDKQNKLTSTQIANINDIPNKASLADVATAGFIKNESNAFNYNNLSNKPTIPSISGLATEEQLNNGLAGKMDKTPATISLAQSGNPWIKLQQTNGTKYYLQVASNMLGLGTTWETATKWDSSGNFAVVGNATIKNGKQVATTEFVNTELTKKADTSGTYDSLVAGKAKELSTSDNTKVTAEGLNELNINYSGASFINYRGGSNSLYIGNGDGSDTRGTLYAGNIYSNAKLVLTEHQDISGKADKTYVNTEVGKKQNTLSPTQINNINDVQNKVAKLANWNIKQETDGTILFEFK